VEIWQVYTSSELEFFSLECRKMLYNIRDKWYTFWPSVYALRSNEIVFRSAVSTIKELTGTTTMPYFSWTTSGTTTPFTGTGLLIDVGVWGLLNYYEL